MYRLNSKTGAKEGLMGAHSQMPQSASHLTHLEQSHIPNIHYSPASAGGLLHGREEDSTHTAWSGLVNLDEYPVAHWLDGFKLCSAAGGGEGGGGGGGG